MAYIWRPYLFRLPPKPLTWMPNTTREIFTIAAISMTGTRDVASQAAVQTTNTRDIATVSAQYVGHQDVATVASVITVTRNVDTRAAITTVNSLDIATAAAAQMFVTRDIASVAALSQAALRDILTAASLSTPFANRDIATVASIIIIPPDYGAMRVDVYDTAGQNKLGYGPIVTINGFDYSEDLDIISAGTLIVGTNDPNVSAIVDRCIVKVYMMGETTAPVFIGKVYNQIFAAGTVTLSLFGVEEDLIGAKCPPGTVFTYSTLSNFMTQMVAILPPGWSVGTVGTSFKLFSKDVSFETVWQAFLDAGSVFGMRLRVNQAAKTIDMTNSFGTSGITLLQALFTNRDATLGYITGAQYRINSQQLINRISAFGAGSGFAQLDMGNTTHGRNLIRYGDMERLALDGVHPFNWGAGDNQVTQDTTFFRSGTASLKVVLSTSPGTYTLSYKSIVADRVWPIASSAGHTLHVEAWVFNGQATVRPFQIRVHDAGNVEVFTSASVNVPGNVWTLLSLDVTLTSNLWIWPEVDIIRPSGATAGERWWVDDVGVWDTIYHPYKMKTFKVTTTGQVVPYFQDDAAVAAQGGVVRPAYVSWNDFVPTSADWNAYVAACNILADRAVRILQLNKSGVTEFTPTVVGLSHALRAGQMVRAIYHNEDDNIQVDANFWVMGRKYSYRGGSESWTLSLKDRDIIGQNELALLTSLASDVHALNFAPGLQQTPLLFSVPALDYSNGSSSTMLTDMRNITSIDNVVLEIHSNTGPTPGFEVRVINPEGTNVVGTYSVVNGNSTYVDLTSYFKAFGSQVPWYDDGAGTAYGPRVQVFSRVNGTQNMNFNLRVQAFALTIPPAAQNPTNYVPPVIPPGPAEVSISQRSYNGGYNVLNATVTNGQTVTWLPPVDRGVVVLKLTYVKGLTPTISDNMGNTWIKAGSYDIPYDGGYSVINYGSPTLSQQPPANGTTILYTRAYYYIYNTVANASNLVITFGGLIATSMGVTVMEFAGLAHATNPLDKTQLNVCAARVPAGNTTYWASSGGLNVVTQYPNSLVIANNHSLRGGAFLPGNAHSGIAPNGVTFVPADSSQSTYPMSTIQHSVDYTEWAVVANAGTVTDDFEPYGEFVAAGGNDRYALNELGNGFIFSVVFRGAQ